MAVMIFFYMIRQTPGSTHLPNTTLYRADNAKTGPLAGKTSVIQAMPEDMLINSYQLSSMEARRIKYNRKEVTILSPQFSQSQQAGSSWSIV